MTTFHYANADSVVPFSKPLVLGATIDTSNGLDPATFDQCRQSRPNFPRLLTPPPDMSNVRALPSFHLTQEHGCRFVDHTPAQLESGSTHATNTQNESSHDALQLNVGARSSRASGTIPAIDGGPSMNSHQEQKTQAESVTTNLQIPKSVNTLGGSLSELAAQITCLFWFESIDVLQTVEDASIAPFPQKALVPDAKPTASFCKFVSSTLTTTCVAQNVVLLALLFIYRLKQQNRNVRAKPGSEYRLLTVALMLGNKFLDDNTYTNKTWAEVSGIDVTEVHIMEVEFLSNMKYCLFTSEQDWQDWQSLLGRFVTFYDRAYRPQAPRQLASHFPPASSLHLPRSLPSPPSSNQASPPYMTGESALVPASAFVGSHGLTPAPSPLAIAHDTNTSTSQQYSRKRSLDENPAERPAKRMSAGYNNYTSPQRFSHKPVQSGAFQAVPRLTLPSYPTQSTATSQPPTCAHLFSNPQVQLPPLTTPARVPARAMGMVYPSASTQAYVPCLSAAVGVSPVAQQISSSQAQSRHQSPYGTSTTSSPSVVLPPSASALLPSTQISPSFFLQQRNSPYRPVHRVSTLLFPPPSSATHPRPASIGLDQMQYQPLGQPVQHNGRLPYLSQNQWLNGADTHEMTPIHRWPGFTNREPAPACATNTTQ